MHTPAAHAPALTAVYPGDAQHIRAVRTDIRTVLGDSPRADDAVLCASELAANAALHSRSCLPGGTFTVQAIISPGHYTRIEVRDDGGPWNQAMVDPARHHGLDIVRAVADEWGIDGDHASRTIWARFDWSE
ncbi:MAG TPA: ATP-binding protein [Streptosporangiaceae bacterium]|nr:ATP-binding protein [Streptosporangiaceae bacterium]